MSIVALFVACDSSEPIVDEPINDPIIVVDSGAITTESISFTVTSTDAESVAYYVVEAKEGTPSVTTIFSEGMPIDANKTVNICAEGLVADTEYIVAAAAKAGNKSATTTTKVRTMVLMSEEIETISQQFVSAKRIGADDAAEGLYSLVFDGEGVRLALELTAVSGDLLPKGVYTPGDTRFGLNIDNTLLECNGSEIRFSAGNVVVEVNEDNIYSFAITLESESLKLEGSYEGAVEDMPKVDEPDPTPDPTDLVFESASSNWNGADHVVTFATADGSVKLVADIYTYNPYFQYLDAGVYTVINSGYSFDAGQIDYWYSTYTVDGESSKLDSGTITVAICDDLTYVVNIDVVDALGRTVQTEYIGVIDGMSFVNGYTWVVAARNKVSDDEEDGQFNITFKTAGSESADYITLDFYADTDATRLPAGTYTITEGNEPGSVDVSTISFVTFSSGSPIIDGGEVVVEYDVATDEYSVTFRMTEKDSYRIWECSYQGTIYGMIIEPETATLNFVSASASYSDDSCEWSVYLVADNGKQLKLGLIDKEWNTSYITPGNYVVGSNWAAGEIYSGWYGVDYTDGIGFKNGNATFIRSGAGYRITVSLTLINDNVYQGSYSGIVQGVTF